MNMRELVRNRVRANKFNLMELAGAFGDLGTLLPYVLVYLTVLKFDPVAVLFAFGIANIATGLVYKTPVPVQPMKAIGTAAAVHAGQVTQGMIWGSGVFTGIVWIVLAATGTIELLARIVGKPVIKGIILGLGLSFVLQGLGMMGKAPILAVISIIILLVLQKNKKIPVVFVLLAFGLLSAIIAKPELMTTLAQVRPSLSLPSLGWNRFTFGEFSNGVLALGLAQLPLTLGNGILALAAENNKLFQDHQTNERKIAMTTGLMNLFSPILGGIPMCHGAGGMAGHVRFGARTGGATIMLGGILLVLSLFFGEFLTFFLQLFPAAVLGVIVATAGIQLGLSARSTDYSKSDIFILLATAAIGLWNIGAALGAGVVLYYLVSFYQKHQSGSK